MEDKPKEAETAEEEGIEEGEETDGTKPRWEEEETEETERGTVQVKPREEKVDEK